MYGELSIVAGWDDGHEISANSWGRKIHLNYSTKQQVLLSSLPQAYHERGGSLWRI